MKMDMTGKRWTLLIWLYKLLEMETDKILAARVRRNPLVQPVKVEWSEWRNSQRFYPVKVESEPGEEQEHAFYVLDC